MGLAGRGVAFAAGSVVFPNGTGDCSNPPKAAAEALGPADCSTLGFTEPAGGRGLSSKARMVWGLGVDIRPLSSDIWVGVGVATQ